jgi:hypothetical protein
MSETRVIFAVATEADGALIWDRLRGIQTELFAAGPISIKVAYFGREIAPPNRPFISTRWAADAGDFQALVDHARTRCVCGC